MFREPADGLAARREIEGLVDPPHVAGALLGDWGQPDDGATLLAVHVGDERVSEIEAIVERLGGSVMSVLPL